MLDELAAPKTAAPPGLRQTESDSSFGSAGENRPPPSSNRQQQLARCSKRRMNPSENSLVVKAQQGNKSTTTTSRQVQEEESNVEDRRDDDTVSTHEHNITTHLGRIHPNTNLGENDGDSVSTTSTGIPFSAAASHTRSARMARLQQHSSRSGGGPSLTAPPQAVRPLLSFPDGSAGGGASVVSSDAPSPTPSSSVVTTTTTTSHTSNNNSASSTAAASPNRRALGRRAAAAMAYKKSAGRTKSPASKAAAAAIVAATTTTTTTTAGSSSSSSTEFQATGPLAESTTSSSSNTTENASNTTSNNNGNVGIQPANSRLWRAQKVPMKAPAPTTETPPKDSSGDSSAPTTPIRMRSSDSTVSGGGSDSVESSPISASNNSAGGSRRSATSASAMASRMASLANKRSMSPALRRYRREGGGGGGSRTPEQTTTEKQDAAASPASPSANLVKSFAASRFGSPRRKSKASSSNNKASGVDDGDTTGSGGGGGSSFASSLSSLGFGGGVPVLQRYVPGITSGNSSPPVEEAARAPAPTEPRLEVEPEPVVEMEPETEEPEVLQPTSKPGAPAPSPVRGAVPSPSRTPSPSTRSLDRGSPSSISTPPPAPPPYSSSSSASRQQPTTGGRSRPDLRIEIRDSLNNHTPAPRSVNKFGFSPSTTTTTMAGASSPVPTPGDFGASSKGDALPLLTPARPTSRRGTSSSSSSQRRSDLRVEVEASAQDNVPPSIASPTSSHAADFSFSPPGSKGSTTTMSGIPAVPTPGRSTAATPSSSSRPQQPTSSSSSYQRRRDLRIDVNARESGSPADRNSNRSIVGSGGTMTFGKTGPSPQRSNAGGGGGGQLLKFSPTNETDEESSVQESENLSVARGLRLIAKKQKQELKPRKSLGTPNHHYYTATTTNTTPTSSKHPSPHSSSSASETEGVISPTRSLRQMWENASRGNPSPLSPSSQEQFLRRNNPSFSSSSQARGGGGPRSSTEPSPWEWSAGGGFGGDDGVVGDSSARNNSANNKTTHPGRLRALEVQKEQQRWQKLQEGSFAFRQAAAAAAATVDDEVDDGFAIHRHVQDFHSIPTIKSPTDAATSSTSGGRGGGGGAEKWDTDWNPYDDEDTTSPDGSSSKPQFSPISFPNAASFDPSPANETKENVMTQPTFFASEVSDASDKLLQQEEEEKKDKRRREAAYAAEVKKQKEKEEEAKRRQMELEAKRRQMELEAKRQQQEEEAKRQRDSAAMRQKQEEEARRQRELEARRQMEWEAMRQKQEEEAKRQRQEQEAMRQRQEQEAMRQRQEQEAMRQRQEEEARKQKELAEKQKESEAKKQKGKEAEAKSEFPKSSPRIMREPEETFNYEFEPVMGRPDPPSMSERALTGSPTRTTRSSPPPTVELVPTSPARAARSSPPPNTMLFVSASPAASPPSSSPTKTRSSPPPMVSSPTRTTRSSPPTIDTFQPMFVPGESNSRRASPTSRSPGSHGAAGGGGMLELDLNPYLTRHLAAPQLGGSTTGGSTTAKDRLAPSAKIDTLVERAAVSEAQEEERDEARKRSPPQLEFSMKGDSDAGSSKQDSKLRMSVGSNSTLVGQVHLRSSSGETDPSSSLTAKLAPDANSNDSIARSPFAMDVAEEEAPTTQLRLPSASADSATDTTAATNSFTSPLLNKNANPTSSQDFSPREEGEESKEEDLVKWWQDTYAPNEKNAVNSVVQRALARSPVETGLDVPKSTDNASLFVLGKETDTLESAPEPVERVAVVVEMPEPEKIPEEEEEDVFSGIDDDSSLDDLEKDKDDDEPVSTKPKDETASANVATGVGGGEATAAKNDADDDIFSDIQSPVGEDAKKNTFAIATEKEDEEAKGADTNSMSQDLRSPRDERSLMDAVTDPSSSKSSTPIKADSQQEEGSRVRAYEALHPPATTARENDISAPPTSAREERQYEDVGENDMVFGGGAPGIDSLTTTSDITSSVVAQEAGMRSRGLAIEVDAKMPAEKEMSALKEEREEQSEVDETTTTTTNNKPDASVMSRPSVADPFSPSDGGAGSLASKSAREDTDEPSTPYNFEYSDRTGSISTSHKKGFSTDSNDITTDSSFSHGPSDASQTEYYEDTTEYTAVTPAGANTAKSFFSQFACGFFDTIANAVCDVPVGPPPQDQKQSVRGTKSETRMADLAEAEDSDEDEDESTRNRGSEDESDASETLNSIHSTSGARGVHDTAGQEQRVWNVRNRNGGASAGGVDKSQPESKGGESGMGITDQQQERQAQHLERRARAHEKLLLLAQNALSEAEKVQGGAEKQQQPSQQQQQQGDEKEARDEEEQGDRQLPPPPSAKAASTPSPGIVEKDEQQLQGHDEEEEGEEVEEEGVEAPKIDETSGEESETKAETEEPATAAGAADAGAGAPPAASLKEETSDEMSRALRKQTLEAFCAKLKDEGMELLKLNRDRKWQGRYLTVSKEVTWLNQDKEQLGPGDCGFCPQGLLWVKKFSKTKEHSVSSLDKTGKGGMLMARLMSINQSSEALAQYPMTKKQQSQYRSPAAVTLHFDNGGVPRPVTFQCRSKEDADYLCAGCHAVINALKEQEEQKKAKQAAQQATA